jgi:hypothetical protein
MARLEKTPGPCHLNYSRSKSSSGLARAKETQFGLVDDALAYLATNPPKVG